MKRGVAPGTLSVPVTHGVTAVYVIRELPDQIMPTATLEGTPEALYAFALAILGEAITEQIRRGSA